MWRACYNYIKNNSFSFSFLNVLKKKQDLKGWFISLLWKEIHSFLSQSDLNLKNAPSLNIISGSCKSIDALLHLKLEHVGSQHWWATWGFLSDRFAVHPGIEVVNILPPSLENISESLVRVKIVPIKLHLCWQNMGDSKEQCVSFAVLWNSKLVLKMFLKKSYRRHT